MKLIFLLFLFFINAFAANELCSTIQIKTLLNTPENRTLLAKNNYPQSCEIVELGRVVTVRCECIESDAEVQSKFDEYKRKYKEAVVVKVVKKSLESTPPVVTQPAKPVVLKNSSSDNELCYTLQLVSKYDTKESQEYFSHTNYPNGCEKMQVGNYLTVRCQCLQSRGEAQDLLPVLKKDYPEAMVLRTAKSRFKNQNTQDAKTPFVAQVAQKVKALVAKPIEILSITTLQSTDTMPQKEEAPKPKSNTPVERKKSSSSGVCHSVQLMSKYDTQENRELFLKESYPSGCKMMKIGSYLTQRCECLDEKESAIEKLPLYKKEYPEAIVVRTARYRFDTQEEKKVQKPVVIVPVVTPPPPPPTPIEVKPVVVETEVIEPMQEVQVESQEPLEVPKKVEEVKEPKEEIVTPKVEEKQKSKKTKKVKKKKKKKNEKYVKRQENPYFYDKYLNKLESRRGIGPLDYHYSFGGRVEYDVGYVSEADAEYSNGILKRGRLSHEGGFIKEKLFYEMTYDFVDTDHYKDIYIGYKNKIKILGIGYRIKAGNLKVPFSLERYGSSKNITFMEKAFNAELSLGRKIGLELLLSKKIEDTDRVNIFTSLFSNSIDERRADEVNTNGFSLRATYLHKFAKHHLFSFGFGYIQEDVLGENIKFSESAETDFMHEKYVSEKVKNVDSVARKNLELLYIYNALSFQAEYTQVFLDALKDGYYYDAYYAQASYFLYGQGRSYKANNSSISQAKLDKYGGVELAFRYSYLNLNADGVEGVDPQNGGTQSDYNFGLNYYINNEFKLMFNYIVAKPKDTENYSGLLQVAQARLQFAF